MIIGGCFLVIKVLIIEDEAGVRNGLIKCVKWEEIGCRVCGEADSGLMALEKFLEVSPDIIISDIVMPGIDGITFLQYVKSRNKEVKIILVTGHRDFEYAVDAVNYGASTLLKKPISYNELVSTLKRLVLEIKQERNMGVAEKALMKKSKDSIRKREELLNGIIFNEAFLNSDISEQLQEFNLNLRKFCIVTTGLDKKNDVTEDTVKRHNVIFNLYTIIREQLKDEIDIIPLFVKDLYVSIIFDIKSDSNLNEKDIINYIRELHVYIRDSFRYDFSFGISSIKNNVSCMKNSFNESLKAFEDRFFSGENSLNIYRNINSGKELGISLLFDLEDKIIKLFKNLSGVELNKSVNKIFEEIVDKIQKDEQINKTCILSILVLVIKKVYGEDAANIDRMFIKYDYFKGIVQADYLYKIKDIFTSTIIDLYDYSIKRKDSSKKEIIKIIKDYLDINYSKNITLNDIAELVYFSPSYVSSFIKAEEGKSFIDILNEIRISKAKEMMRSSELKTYEIAEKVGFADSNYFSQVFKKITGKTPKDYYEEAKV